MREKQYLNLSFLFLILLSQSTICQWTKLKKPDNKSIVRLAGIGEHVFAAVSSRLPYGDSIFMSTNHGENWDLINNGLPPTISIHDFAVKDSILFVATYDGIFKTTNFGKEWLTASSGLTTQNIWVLNINGDKIYAGGVGPVFISTNLGNNWTLLKDIGWPSSIQSIASFGDNIFVLLPYSGRNKWSEVWRSTNNGFNWKNIFPYNLDTRAFSLFTLLRESFREIY